jgi:hypothetical protein
LLVNPLPVVQALLTVSYYGDEVGHFFDGSSLIHPPIQARGLLTYILLNSQAGIFSPEKILHPWHRWGGPL